VAYGASVAAQEQDRRLATTFSDKMYGRENDDIKVT
jgi:hypothetical protein